ncbi:Acid phosphatase 1-like protein [Drosera capensis]
MSFFMEVHCHICSVEAYNNTLFEKWAEKAIAPAIKPNLELYKKLLGLGIKVFLLTGRSESQRNITVRNLKSAGFANWYKLILRSTAEEGTLAVVYKSGKRSEIVKSGYRIMGSSGDQWSDLLGSPMAARSFKVPNPMYHIS